MPYGQLLKLMHNLFAESFGAVDVRLAAVTDARELSHMASITSLNDALSSAPPFGIEILSAAELDAVSGGDGEIGRGLSGGDSNTTSVCSTDGSDEPGTR